MYAVTTESSSAGDGHPQQDGGDVGASVIDHLPAGVSAQCESCYVQPVVCALHVHAKCIARKFYKNKLLRL